MIVSDWWLATLFLYILGIAFALDAIWQGRTAQGTIAWIVALIFVPMVGIPLYLLFGSRRFHGYRLARRRGDARLNALGHQIRHSLMPFASRANTITQPLYNFFRLPMTHGNQCQLLINGEQTFAAMEHAIQQASHSICVQFYIVRDDTTGQRLADALSEKAQQGVQVYFLYDEIGSHGLKNSFLTTMADAGIRISRFNALQLRHRLQINFRNHRKLMLIDGEQCFIGGINLGDEYLHQNNHWRDTHLQIRGPSALTFQLSFIEDWYWATQYLPRLKWQPLPANDLANSDLTSNESNSETNNSAVMCINTGPADSQESASLFFSHLIHQAKNRVWIATPYFVPDIATLSALRLAALKGLDVRVILPANTDKWLVQQAMGSYVEELSPCGVQFYSYQPGFMHQKVLLIDQHWSSIGSANLDNRSLRINFEANALICDEKFATQVETMLKQDLEQSLPMAVDSSRIKRLLTKTARLSAQIL